MFSVRVVLRGMREVVMKPAWEMSKHGGPVGHRAESSFGLYSVMVKDIVW
jgi:hypothetical protein